MARRTVTVTIRHSGFEATETFMSKADAVAWREMVETTLDHREKVNFDLTVYAQGLADKVRTRQKAFRRISGTVKCRAALYSAQAKS